MLLLNRWGIPRNCGANRTSTNQMTRPAVVRNGIRGTSTGEGWGHGAALTPPGRRMGRPAWSRRGPRRFFAIRSGQP